MLATSHDDVVGEKDVFSLSLLKELDIHFDVKSSSDGLGDSVSGEKKSGRRMSDGTRSPPKHPKDYSQISEPDVDRTTAPASEEALLTGLSVLRNAKPYQQRRIEAIARKRDLSDSLLSAQCDDNGVLVTKLGWDLTGMVSLETGMEIVTSIVVGGHFDRVTYGELDALYKRIATSLDQPASLKVQSTNLSTSATSVVPTLASDQVRLPLTGCTAWGTYFELRDGCCNEQGPLGWLYLIKRLKQCCDMVKRYKNGLRTSSNTSVRLADAGSIVTKLLAAPQLSYLLTVVAFLAKPFCSTYRGALSNRES